MPDHNAENTQPAASPESIAPQKRLSPLAKWAFRLAIIGAVLVGFGILGTSLVNDFAMISIVVGVLISLGALLTGLSALLRIACDKNHLKGIVQSLVSILISGAVLIFIFVAMYHIVYVIPRQIHCGNNLVEIYRSFSMYSNDHNEKFPTASQWCDLLIERNDVDISKFFCGESDAIKGESSYAMNKYIVGMNIGEIPAGVVVLFETNYGSIAKRNKQSLQQLRRDRYCSINEVNGVPKLSRTDKLDKLRWNQVGGPEILALDHHGGANVIFADGHIEFVKKKDISKLRWKP